ncbi:MAG TPA: sulfite exporter TauE/SafE family protein [Actinomycetota bacterium]
MDAGQILIVAAVGLVAGAVNSVAGGGTLITYPALVFVGLNPVVANATSTLALWPGYVSATVGFRRELSGTRRLLLALALPSLSGGVLGAVLLLRTPTHTFELLAPVLILFAAVLLLVQDRAPPSAHHARLTAAAWTGLLAWQLGAAVYGGYFGAGLGFVLLAGYGLLGTRDFLRSSGLKNATTVLINGIALVYFVAKGAVVWADGLAMAVGAIVGGYGGATLARRVGAERIRRAVVILGFAMAVALLVRALT